MKWTNPTLSLCTSAHTPLFRATLVALRWPPHPLEQRGATHRHLLSRIRPPPSALPLRVCARWKNNFSDESPAIIAVPTWNWQAALTRTCHTSHAINHQEIGAGKQNDAAPRHYASNSGAHTLHSYCRFQLYMCIPKKKKATFFHHIAFFFFFANPRETRTSLPHFKCAGGHCNRSQPSLLVA